MLRFPQNWINLYEDALVIRYRNPYSGQITCQGKRVGKDCVLSPEERRVYVKSNASSVMLVKEIRMRRNCTLAEAWKICQVARGYGHMELNPYMPMRGAFSVQRLRTTL